MSLFKKLLGYPAEEQAEHTYHKKQDVEYMRDAIEFVKLAADTDMLQMADKLMNSVPLVINVEDLTISEANQAIAFLSGILYAKDGTNLQLSDKVFLFTLDENLSDGTIMEFYEEYKQD